MRARPFRSSCEQDPCTVDECIDRKCVSRPRDPNALCDDSDPCTTDDRCNAEGLCVGKKDCPDNCNAPNGDSYDQGEDICDGIKAAGVVVYTVGFDIADQQEAKDLMANCASSPEFAFLANSGTELKDAFRAIGANIASLRVSR